MLFSKISSVYEVCSKNEFYYAIRNSLTNDNFLLNGSEFEQLKKDIKENNNSRNIKKLKRAHIVVPDNYSENKFIEFIKKQYGLDEPDINIFYLTFNNECNLACKYCYVEGSYDKTKKNIVMDDGIFSKTLLFLENFLRESIAKQKSQKKLSFIYYGSEPLLNKKQVITSIKRIDEICKKLNLDKEIQIITNATLIDDEYIKCFTKHGVELAISLDGSKEINDSMRIFKADNSGTFNHIKKAIDKLNKAKVNFGISCTIGPHNADFLKENIEYFKQLNAGGVGFNTLLEAKNKDVPFLSINKANDNLIDASDFANKNSLYEDRIQRKVKAFNKSDFPHFKDCGAIGNQLVFYPDGNIGVCQAYLGCKKPIVGNVSKDKDNPLKVLGNDIMKKWSRRHPVNMEECVYCPAIGICGGGCVFNAEIKYGDLYAREKAFCIHTHKILDWLLIKSIKEKLNTEDVYIKDISFMWK